MDHPQCRPTLTSSHFLLYGFWTLSIHVLNYFLLFIIEIIFKLVKNDLRVQCIVTEADILTVPLLMLCFSEHFEGLWFI